MGATSKKEPTKKRRPPAKTVEGVEHQLVGLAVDLAKKQLEAGTASSQIISHFLQLGTTRSKFELEKMKLENELLKAKADALESAKESASVYQEALDAMRSYSGSQDSEEIIDE